MKTGHIERSGVDAGWRVLFAFGRNRPRATHRERLLASNPQLLTPEEHYAS